MVQKREGINVLGALSDLVILVLMVGGAGFGGYYLGVHQQLAPIQKVAPGTKEAVEEQQAEAPVEADSKMLPIEEEKPTTKPASAKPKTSRKYWLSSSGVEYIGYSITVKVNGTAVDNFFGPGKNVDITRLVKKGTNTVVFDAKELGEQYNKHVGDDKAVLSVKIVSGPYIQENFSSKDVLLSYARNAAESESFADTKTFVGE
ncbi:MAG: hypothetical protein K2Y22_10095 [Candidatus Obscuribacterales bacterium]|nr:hypothetical protein [Candidatus Obscuribacterales bacterium]